MLSTLRVLPPRAGEGALPHSDSHHETNPSAARHVDLQIAGRPVLDQADAGRTFRARHRRRDAAPLWVADRRRRRRLLLRQRLLRMGSARGQRPADGFSASGISRGFEGGRRGADARQPVARACQIMTQNKVAPTSNPNDPMIVGNTGPPLNVNTRPMSVIGVATTNIQNW